MKNYHVLLITLAFGVIVGAAVPAHAADVYMKNVDRTVTFPIKQLDDHITVDGVVLSPVNIERGTDKSGNYTSVCYAENESSLIGINVKYYGVEKGFIDIATCTKDSN